MFRDPVSFSGNRIRNPANTAEMRPKGPYGVIPHADDMKE
jgi:hypothetical protein